MVGPLLVLILAALGCGVFRLVTGRKRSTSGRLEERMATHGGRSDSATLFATGIALRWGASSHRCRAWGADRGETRPQRIVDPDNCHDRHPVHGTGQATGAHDHPHRV